MCPASSFLRALLRHVVLKESSVVIMDMEAGIEHLGRGTTRGIDLMIVVVEPGARSLETAERIKRLGTDIGVTKFAAVINKAGEEDLGAVEYRLENMGIPVLGTIPYDSSLVKADLAGRSPVEEGGAAMAAIEGIKDRLVLI